MEFYKELFKESSFPVVITNDDFKLLDVNKAAESYFKIQDVNRKKSLSDLTKDIIGKFSKKNEITGWCQYITEGETASIFYLLARTQVNDDIINAITFIPSAENTDPGIKSTHDNDIHYPILVNSSEEKYKLLVEQANDAIIINNAEGQILDSNKAARHFLGYSKEEYLSFNVRDIISKEELERVPIKEAELKRGETVKTERTLLHKSGKLITALITSKALSDGRIMVIARDSTELNIASQKILKERNLSDAIINNLPGIFFLFNKNGKFLRWNKNFEEFSIYNRREIPFKNPLDFVEEEDKGKISEVIQKVFKDGKGDIEANLLNKDGVFVPMYFTGWAAVFEDEPCLIGMAIDISARIKAESELKQQEQKFNSLVNTINGVVWEADAHSLQFTFVSKQAEQLLGYPLEAWMTDRQFLANHLHPEDKDITISFLESLKTGQKDRLLEYRMLKASGEIIWLEDIVAVITEENGQILLRGIITDITERKKKELELQQSHAKYMAIIDNSLNAFMLTNDEGDIIDTNETARNMLGYTEEELRHLKTWDIFDVNDNKFKDGVALRKQTGRGKGEVNGIKKNGERLPLAFTSSTFVDSNGRQMVSAIGIDISERIKYEENLLKSNERFEKVSEATFDAIWDWDVKTHELYFGEGFKELFGYEVKNSIGDFSTWADHIHPDDRADIILSRLNKIMQYDNNTWRDEYRYIRADGSTAYVLDRGILLRENGMTYRMIGAMQDITNSKKTEEALLASNERFRYVSKATFDAIWDRNLITREIYWGEGFQQLFGHTHLENSNSIESWDKLIHAEDHDRVLEGIDAAIKSDAQNWKDDYRFKRADGKYAFVADRGIIIRDELGESYRMIGAMRDITERKIAEERMSELNKELEYKAQQLSVSNAELESFAYVASHDLQEPLRMVSSFLQLLQKKYESVLDEKGLKYINFAIDGSERMKTLIQDLLEFSRINTNKEVHKQVDLNTTIIQAQSNLRKVIEDSGATLKVSILPIIYGNESQLLQLFQNLISNAIKYRSEEPPLIEVSYEERETDWFFSIKDNGIGIDDKFFGKIFVIFQRLHNRKEFDGTGIGLAVCKKIVDFHGGKIWVESILGKGSTFNFTISKYLI